MAPGATRPAAMVPDATQPGAVQPAASQLAAMEPGAMRWAKTGAVLIPHALRHPRCLLISG
jgi:hypothetical protein